MAAVLWPHRWTVGLDENGGHSCTAASQQMLLQCNVILNGTASTAALLVNVHSSTACGVYTLRPVLQPVGRTTQVSPAKRRLSRPARTLNDVTARRLCGQCRRCGAFDRMNIQNVSTSRLYATGCKVYALLRGQCLSGNVSSTESGLTCTVPQH